MDKKSKFYSSKLKSKVLNYNYDYKLWTWENISEIGLPKDIESLLIKWKNLNLGVKLNVLVGDYLRWAICTRFGGFYFDCDIDLEHVTTLKNIVGKCSILLPFEMNEDGSPIACAHLLYIKDTFSNRELLKNKIDDLFRLRFKELGLCKDSELIYNFNKIFSNKLGIVDATGPNFINSVIYNEILKLSTVVRLENPIYINHMFNGSWVDGTDSLTLDSLHCYVVNLLDREERKSDTLKELESIGIRHVKVIPAVDTRSISPFSPYRASGQIGCLLSHRQCIADIYASNYKYGLICEDDIKINDLDNFKSQFNKIIEELPSDWDILTLGYQKLDAKFVSISDNLDKYISDELWCAHFYLVNSKACYKLLKAIDKFEEVADTVIYLPEFNVYMPKDSMVRQIADHSDIENKQVKAKGLY